MTNRILFYDGCNICLSIEATFNELFSAAPGEFESVNLGLDTARSAEAVQLGVTRLPSLVVNGKVLRIEDHSPIARYLSTASRNVHSQ
ncbi:MAG: hypothetical protein H7293_04695 [Candidatus Saccharibacteria bacterium]|nr:hypothetical protein [Rhodoferax sp.]